MSVYESTEQKTRYEKIEQNTWARHMSLPNYESLNERRVYRLHPPGPFLPCSLVCTCNLRHRDAVYKFNWYQPIMNQGERFQNAS